MRHTPCQAADAEFVGLRCADPTYSSANVKWSFRPQQRLRDLLVKSGSSADWFELKDPGPVLDSQRNTDLRIVTLQGKRAAHADGDNN